MGWVRDRRLVAALAVAYVVALAVLVTAPWGWKLNRLTVALYVQFRYDWPIAPDLVGPNHYGALLNVLLYVPLGAFAGLNTRWAWWWVTIAAALGSVMIELAQLVWLSRVADLNDIFANTLGALLGAVAISLLARAGSRRACRPEPPRRP